MRTRVGPIVLTTFWLVGCGAQVLPGPGPTSGAGSAETATDPTAAPPSSAAPLGERVLQAARQYRGNPPWLGIATGGLLVVALVAGALELRGLRRAGDRQPPRAS